MKDELRFSGDVCVCVRAPRNPEVKGQDRPEVRAQDRPQDVNQYTGFVLVFCMHALLSLRKTGLQ